VLKILSRTRIVRAAKSNAKGRSFRSENAKSWVVAPRQQPMADSVGREPAAG
jgi:hypothetical protein